MVFQRVMRRRSSTFERVEAPSATEGKEENNLTVTREGNEYIEKEEETYATLRMEEPSNGPNVLVVEEGSEAGTQVERWVFDGREFLKE